MFQWVALQELLPGAYGHMFNFCLSYMLLAGVGFLWLMVGVTMRQVAWAALALVVANIGYETLLPVLNTRDPMDAIYGVVGTAAGFAWLAALRRFGLVALQRD